ncbi:MAG TPA: mucoidy inhibitor MuiA family protein, partial [Solirubrobacteraceae bacterium]|nr:mucoidy inhibitor MuiA family protein [Solirubrobacteraceae bacterium]
MESRIEQVTIYARGAVVRRVATAAAPATVRITGLPLAVIDDTVRVEVEGGPVAATVRTGTDAPGEAEAEESAELRAARRREAIATAEVVRLETALERLAQAPVIADGDSDEPPPAWSAVVAARAQLIEVRAAREQALREALAAGRRELDEAHRLHEVIATREALKGTAKGPKLHELRKHVELELTGTGTATLRIEYQVGAARWAPSYVARLDGVDTRFELRAIVAQDSGEDWTGVALRLSTAEPARFAPLPELSAQRIGRRQQEPVRRGFRAPPAGAEQLYGDYDRSFPRALPATFEPPFDDSTYEGRAPAAPEEDLAAQVWDEDSSHAKGVYP